MHDQGNQGASISGLRRFLQFETVSARGRSPAFANCAAWLAATLQGIGMSRTRIVPTSGNPVVLAERAAPRRRPTVLVYGHYDVQPADPLGEWHSPPFAPEIRGDYLYGRGASDDKGQLFAHICAVERLLRKTGELPVHVKFLLEGEEEIGSPSLPAFLARNRQAAAADLVVVSDSCMLGPDRPAITYALRGSLDLELGVSAGRGDLHSGNFGGAVENPVEALCGIVAGLEDASGRILLPGFYDRVRPVSEAERAYLRRRGPSDAQVLAAAGAAKARGTGGWTLYESTTIRPVLTVTGITGGYQGPGPKGIIPARARAKLNFRLVPDQDPAEIESSFRETVSRLAPKGLRVSVEAQKRTPPALVDLRHAAIPAVSRACRRAFGRAPVLLRSGGTIPVVGLLQRVLGIPAVLLGFALPDDNLHAPNERLHLPTFFKAIAASAGFLEEVAKLREGPGRNRSAGASRRGERSEVPGEASA
jgi:acetylornithine deacetylase/succinyl-diaminopimelate desuccinylase-like protein